MRMSRRWLLGSAATCGVGFRDLGLRVWGLGDKRQAQRKFTSENFESRLRLLDFGFRVWDLCDQWQTQHSVRVSEFEFRDFRVYSYRLRF
jgi:hypothetical protein